jgi:hypothetical protein
MDLSDAFRQVVSFKEPTGVRGVHGDPDFSAATLQTANARVEPSTRLVTNSLGEEVLTSHFVMMDKALSNFARVWLPGADTSDDQQARQPLRVEQQFDLDSIPSHWEVYF